MSAGISRNLINQVSESAIRSAWVQWRSLGALISAPRPARSIVDPEALVLASLALRDRERRLWDVLASWARTNPRLLSVQRIKNLNSKYPTPTGDRLAEFARIAFLEGGDHRWRKLAGTQSGPRPRHQTLQSPSAEGWDPAALVVRLRLGLGVGLQADVLSFLLSQRGAWTSARVVAEATGYTVYAIRRTADRMAEARLVESTSGKPIEYRTDSGVWGTVLGIKGQVLPWRYWSQTYAFAVDLLTRAGKGELQASTRYLLSSSLRDLGEAHRDAVRLNRIASLDPHQSAGEEYVSAFDQLAAALADRMDEGA
jgi:hypothetical protein